MRIIENLTIEERIVLKWHFDALKIVFCLQRKRWYGWKTTAWIYPSIIARHDSSYDYLKHYLYWEERNFNRNTKGDIERILSTKK